MAARHLRLYINIDHVATVRQARRGAEPSPVEAAAMCELAGADEMIDIAIRTKPQQVTLVPEKREEITTEGGLDVFRETERVESAIARLKAAGIRTSLFIDPTSEAIT